jgi:hypothetical protein
MTETSAENTAMDIVVQKASPMTLLVNILEYHLNVKPPQITLDFESLKDSTMSTMTGE